jgi:beta-glucanase (GH16 family)
MTKKILVLALVFVFSFVFLGCDNLTTSTTTETSTTTTSTQTTTTTQITNTETPLTDLIPEECSLIEVVDGWVPVWCDEFSYTGTVDPTKWTVNVKKADTNDEKQYYTNRTENLYVDGDNLIITALKESYGGLAYTSSKIWTKDTQSFKYGKFEMRAMIPYGRGTWPAFWMMPSASKYGGWPDSGEIDIMEHVGYDLNNVVGTIHTERFYGGNGRGGDTSLIESRGLVPLIDVVNQYHTYSVIWDETSITWYFDDVEYAKVAYSSSIGGTANYDTSVDWPFDQNFYLILNLAIGGTWGGAMGIDDTIFPTSLTVDYVRVYQQDYVSEDTQAPSAPSNPHIVKQSGTSVYLTWTEAEDDMNIAKYYIYVNNALVKKSGVPGVLITNLKLDYDNYITIIAEDYAGNLSMPLETVITT